MQPFRVVVGGLEPETVGTGQASDQLDRGFHGAQAVDPARRPAGLAEPADRRRKQMATAHSIGAHRHAAPRARWIENRFGIVAVRGPEDGPQVGPAGLVGAWATRSLAVWGPGLGPPPSHRAAVSIVSTCPSDGASPI